MISDSSPLPSRGAGEILPGSTVNAGTGDTAVLNITTGSSGTAPRSAARQQPYR